MLTPRKDRNGAPDPSGAQLSIAWGDHAATITEVGATLREYRVGNRHLLDGFEPGEMCSGGRGQLLMPWPNRVADGRYELAAQKWQLALTEPERGHAIHGLVRWLPWRVGDQSPEAVELSLTLYPQPGYPFTVEMGINYQLSEAGLRVSASAQNLGPRAAPFGAGSHPYLKPGGALIDDAMLTIPAASFLEVDDRLIPTGRKLPVAGSPVDFRVPRRLDGTRLDTCFCDFEQPRVTLDDVELWWDPQLQFAQCFTGDTLAADRRRRGLAVEAMTCAPDAFNSGDGLILLAPGQRWTAGWGISPTG